MLPGDAIAQGPPPIEETDNPWRWGVLDMEIVVVEHQGRASNPREGTITQSFTIVGSQAILDEMPQDAFQAEYARRGIGDSPPAGWVRGGILGTFGRPTIQKSDAFPGNSCSSPVTEADGGVDAMWYERDSGGKREFVLAGPTAFALDLGGGSVIDCNSGVSFFAFHPSSPEARFEIPFEIKYTGGGSNCPCSVRGEVSAPPFSSAAVPPQELQPDPDDSITQTREIEVTAFSLRFTSDDHANQGQLEAPVGVLDTGTAIGRRPESAGWIEYDGDEDWFAFEADEGERVTVGALTIQTGRFDLSLEEAAVNVYARGTGGTPIADADPERDGITFTVPATGTYYAAVAGTASGGGSGTHEGTYILKINRGGPDIKLVESDLAPNQDAGVTGVLMGGGLVPPVDITLRADIDWQEAEPGSVEFALEGTRETTEANPDGCTTLLFQGLTFPDGAAGVVVPEAIAVTGADTRSEPKEGQPISVVDAPSWVEAGLAATDSTATVSYEPVAAGEGQPCGGTTRVIYSFDGEIPSPKWEFEATIPSIIPFIGGQNSLTAFIEYTLEVDSTGPVFWDYEMKLSMVIGGKEAWSQGYEGSGEGTITPSGIEWDVFVVSLSGEIPIYQLGGSVRDAVDFVVPGDQTGASPELQYERAKGWFERIYAAILRLAARVSLKAEWALSGEVAGLRANRRTARST